MKNKGFTLMELLVVIAIIGILATVIVTALGNTRDKAMRANALVEMKSIRTVLFSLELDTGVMVGGFPNGTCNANEEYSLNPTSPMCGGGLICNNSQIDPGGATHSYSNWQGPYTTEESLIDPWGNNYLFDYDIHCGGGVNDIPSEKCNGNTGDVVGVTTGGPDGDFFTYNDNEVIVVCP